MTPAANETVAIMGVGWVGGALARWFESQGRVPVRYDPPKGIGTTAELAAAEVVFVCVPTPFDPAAGGFDASFVERAVAAIPGEGKLVVIKSTVLPGTTDRLQRACPRHRLVFNPEFLRQATADDDLRKPDRQIVGLTAAATHADAERVFALMPTAPFTRVVTAVEAETVKYFGNCFLALKVVFANQLFDLCAALDVDYATVRDCAAVDARIGPSHLAVDGSGERGYGGGCFPKDMRAFIQLGDRLGVDLALLKTAERLNNELRLPVPAGTQKRTTHA